MSVGLVNISANQLPNLKKVKGSSTVLESNRPSLEESKDLTLLRAVVDVLGTLLMIRQKEGGFLSEQRSRIIIPSAPIENINLIMRHMGKYLMRLELSSNQVRAQKDLEQLGQGYMDKACVSGVNTPLELYGLIRKVGLLGVPVPFTIQKGSELVKVDRLRLKDVTVMQFMLPMDCKAYSPYIKLCDLDPAKKKRHVFGHWTPEGGPKGTMTLYAPQLPPMPTEICTFVLHDKYGVKWCAGQDPFYVPAREESDRWVRCSFDPKRLKQPPPNKPTIYHKGPNAIKQGAKKAIGARLPVH